jgi:hypothetical protein
LKTPQQILEVKGIVVELIHTGVFIKTANGIRINNSVEGVKFAIQNTDVHYFGFGIEMPPGYICVSPEMRELPAEQAIAMTEKIFKPTLNS